MLSKDALRVSVIRSLYLSARHGGRIVILRGTRLRIDSGARIEVPPGCRLVIGKHHAGGAPASLEMRRNARLIVHGQGRVSFARGARILILDGAQLQIGHETGVNFNTSITCTEHVSIGSGCAISWNVDIFDGNTHESAEMGVPGPGTRPVRIGDHVWIGCGATVANAVIGDGTVVGMESVVTGDVPGEVLVAGNPAQVVREEITWRL